MGNKISSLMPALICGAALLPLHVMAGETAVMNVKATLTPGACSISLDSKTVDYGSLNQEDISQLPQNKTKPSLVELASQKLPVAIKCASKAQVALSVNAKSAGSDNEPQDNTNEWGSLSTSAGEEMGSYSISLNKDDWSVAQAKISSIGLSAASTNNWTAVDTATMKFDETEWATWLGDKSQPVTSDNFTGSINVQAVLNKAKTQGIKDNTPVLGDATLTLHYI